MTSIQTLCFVFTLTLGLLNSSPSYAQQKPPANDSAIGIAEKASENVKNDVQLKQETINAKVITEQQSKAIDQLGEIQISLEQKFIERKEIAGRIKKEGGSASESTLQELEDIDSEIELLNRTFEQIAIGGIDLSSFGVKDSKFDWREELILIVKPLIENVKGLTEKPRKIENLKRLISDKKIARETATDALASIEGLLSQSKNQQVTQRLQSEKDEWVGRAEDLERQLQLAQYQLDSLQGKGVPWVEIVKQGTSQFISGRGLTLLLVIIFAVLIWAFMRGLLWLIRKRSSEKHDRSSKVGYRLAAYGYRFLTGLLIAIAIMMVLYFRQDLLLLAIMVIIFVGAALTLKNLLPKYVTESRLLLNMGGVRENERIIYNGIPWKVSSINMFSLFTNPEIRGALRVPINQMHEMVSRPSVDEHWFPSSEGDWILVDKETPIEVVTQTPDMVALRDLNALCSYMSTADYYQAGYQNITRADVFRVAVRFGIDYSTQGEDMLKIEDAFIQGMKKVFAEADFSEHVRGVKAEFESAGDSSLNYVMLTTFDSKAAGAYNRIQRRINRACVMVCSENDWTIPFPQMSVHVESTPESLQERNDNDLGSSQSNADDTSVDGGDQ